MTFRCPELLALAKQAPCCMACSKRNENDVVAAHANESKAMGMKNPDYQWAALCFRCHAELDQGKDMSREDRRAFWLRAYWRTQEWLWTCGLIVVSHTPQPPAPPPPRPKAKIPKGPKLKGPGFRKDGPKQKIPSRPWAKKPA